MIVGATEANPAGTGSVERPGTTHLTRDDDAPVGGRRLYLEIESTLGISECHLEHAD
jgi:hypothetical protein